MPERERTEDAEAGAYLYKQNTERICTEVIIENVLNFSTEQEEIRMEEKSREVVMAISNAARYMDPFLNYQQWGLSYYCSILPVWSKNEN